MKKIIVGIILVFLSLQAVVSAVEISDADIFVTPKDSGSNYFGGYLGGIDAGVIDWAIGNSVPPDGLRTRDIVFSTCIGDFTRPENWTEQFRVTQGGYIMASPDGTKWVISIDNFGNVITTLKE